MDVPLTELGREQAADARDSLADVALTAIWSSDQLRALQTAEIVASAHALDIRPEPLLREHAFGELEGRLTSELEAQPVPEGQHISEIAWGGGESSADVYERMERLIEVLRAEFGPQSQVVLVSHGDSIRTLLAALDGRGHRDIEDLRVPNATVLTTRLE